MSFFTARRLLLTKSQLFKPQNHNRLFTTCRMLQKAKNDNPEDDDKPIKFSTSKAATWRAETSRTGAKDSIPWFQPYVISLSLAVFMLYFFYLREESDIDQEFNKNLYERIHGLEEKQLEIVLKYNTEHNLPTQDITNRLEEIRNEKT